MNPRTKLLIAVGATVMIAAGVTVKAYPPAVGILGKSQNCLSCHVNNGKWVDGGDLIIDVIERDTRSSLRQRDGSFLLTARRGQAVTVLTVIGYRATNEALIPYRNAWLYVDSGRINTSALSKFPPGWEVNLPMACRIVGDKFDAYPEAQITVLPMTVRPGDSASNGTVTLQVMLTKGETVKGNPKLGMTGNYFERVLQMEVEE